MCCVLVSFLTAVPLLCFELADAGPNLIVLDCSGSAQSANCSFDDGRPPIVPCEHRVLLLVAFKLYCVLFLLR